MKIIRRNRNHRSREIATGFWPFRHRGWIEINASYVDANGDSNEFDRTIRVELTLDEVEKLAELASWARRKEAEAEAALHRLKSGGGDPSSPTFAPLPYNPNPVVEK